MSGGNHPHGDCRGCSALRAQVERLDADVKLRAHEMEDAVGALDDAGVRRNDSDEIASGIEKLAKDRDELLGQWVAVGNLFWPNREPDDGWSAADVGDEVRALRSRVAELEADIASRSGTWTRCRCGGTFRAPAQTGMSVPEHTCPGCRRAEVAEDRVEKLEAVERAAREYRRRERAGGGCDIETTERLACAVEDARRVLDDALAAMEVSRG